MAGSSMRTAVRRAAEPWHSGRMADMGMDAFEAEMSRRNPYGIHPDAKTGALSELSLASRDAAENLLNKAIDRIELGDVERAERFISRAAAIPFDEHEEIWPGPMMADQMLHELLCDFVEDWADAQAYPEDYESVQWLHEHLADIVDDLDAREGAALRDMVETMAADAGVLRIDPLEVRGLLAVVKNLPDSDRADRGLELRAETDTARREEVARLFVGLYVRVWAVIAADDRSDR